MQDADYQSIFNQTLKKISAILSMNPDTQKRVRKALYDFSDELKDKDLLKDKELHNAKYEQSNR